MKVKHLKTKTTIELTPEELEKYRKLTNDLDSMLSSLLECQDMWLSDVRNLETYSYIKEEK